MLAPVANSQAGAPIVNAMSCDVEEYFQVGAFERTIARADWARWPSRVEANTGRVLDLFARHQVQATFFCLGWVAERVPALIRRIVAEGHELASHGYDHARVHDLNPDQFRADLRRTRKLLEDTGGVAVTGYRAPSFSISARNAWALEILAEEGYRYSSSVAPIAHDHYGWPGAPRFAHKPVPDAPLVEFPVTTVRVGKRNFAAGGGGFFRLLPYRLSRAAIDHVNRVEGQPAIFYFHPWEIDPSQPVVRDAPFRSRLRHYTNLDAMERKLDRLLGAFRWGRMDQAFAGVLAP